MLTSLHCVLLLALHLALFWHLSRASTAASFTCVTPTPRANAPRLPNITNQFEATVTANIENKGYKVTVKESYDDVNNRGRIETVGTGTNPAVTRIYDFTDKQWYTIKGTNCTVHNLTPESPFIAFPFRFDNQGNAHVLGIADVLAFGRQYGDVYIGEDTIDGRRVDIWKACQMDELGNSKMSMQWYFAVSENGNSRYGIPVRLVIEGVSDGPNDTTSNNLLDGDDDEDAMADSDRDRSGSSSHYFRHTYDFTSFIAGSPADSLFQVPDNIHCYPYGSHKRLPRMPDTYSVGLQTVYPDIGLVEHGLEYVSYKTKKIVDHAGAFSVVNDFRLGVMFITDPSNCTATELTATTRDNLMTFLTMPAAIPDKNQHLKMKSTRDIFGLMNSDSANYTGTRVVNNILCDVFQDRLVDRPMPGNTTIIEISFAKRSVNYKSQNLLDEHQVPIKIELYAMGEGGEKSGIYIIYNLYDFDTQPQFEPTVDTSLCYQDRKTVSFLVNGEDDSLQGFNKRIFVENIRPSIAAAAQVDESRVVDVKTVDHSEGIMVHATLLDKLPIPTYITTGAQLDDAVINLQQATNKGDIVVKLLPNKQYTSKKYLNNGCHTTIRKPAVCSCSHGSSNSGVIIGLTVGIAVVTLILGIILGVGIVFIIKKRCGKFQLSYEKQVDEKAVV